MNKNNSTFSLRKFIFSIVFNTAVLAIALFVFIPFFEEIDDTHMAMIAEGAFGSKDYHLFFSNVILGKLIVFLQNVAPHIRWHIILQYIFIYIGYVFAVYVLSKHKRGFVLSIAAVLATFFEMYVSVQFTKTATFVCVVGILLILEYVRVCTTERKEDNIIISEDNSKFERRLYYVVGIILIIYGIMLRPDGILLAAVPGTAAGLIELIRTKNIKRYLIAFVPIGVLFVLITLINSNVYTKDNQWSKVMELLDAKTELLDRNYYLLDYNKYGAELDKLGISENDALALITYQYGDENIFTSDIMHGIVNAFPQKQIGYMTFANLFENLVNECIRNYAMIAGLVGLICAYFASIIIDRSKSNPGYIKDSRLKLLSMFIIGAICAAALIYFQYSGRFSHRLFASVVISTILCLCYMTDGIGLKNNDSNIVFGGNLVDRTTIIVSIFSIVIIGCNILLYDNNLKDYHLWETNEAPKLTALDELLNDKDSYYVADTFTMQNIHKYTLFDMCEEGCFDNYVTSGSWFLNSPITKGTMAKYGYSNPYEALRDIDGNVYMIDNLWLESKIIFLNEHYDGAYVAELVDNKGGLDIYKINWTE